MRDFLRGKRPITGVGPSACFKSKGSRCPGPHSQKTANLWRARNKRDLSPGFLASFFDSHGNGSSQGFKIQRFCEVLIKTRVQTFENVFGHSITGERNGRNVALLPDLFHQVQPAAIRQTQVAQEEVIGSPMQGVQGFADGVCRGHRMSHATDDLLQHIGGVRVVLDKQDLISLI